jgi:nitrate/TMAO reductase-like tetraheme cytochrome c subunit
MKSVKEIFITPVKIFWEFKLSVKIFLVLGAVGLFSFVAIELTSTPGFCNSCHIMNPYYDNWKASSHSGVSCTKCHLQPGFTGLIKGKINGMAQSINFIVGRVGTKPNGVVVDSSCLRSHCHDIEELESKNLYYGMAMFTHKGHTSQVVNGITISCGTCHSHFEGDEHFSIDKNVCFTCHFLKSKEGAGEQVQTKCLDCHEIPDKVIERGMVKVNHLEFASYSAGCSGSCHKKQVEKDSAVSDSVCLNCHSFKRTDQETEELHHEHSIGEKVECFSCHGEVSHKPQKLSLETMTKCESCHSNTTHSSQIDVYTAKQHNRVSDERIIGPMFLTHVECTGCHIDPEQICIQTGDCTGTVAKAIPSACDNCHEPGTGEKYIPFWQGKIKKLYEQVSKNLDELEKQLRIKHGDDNTEIEKRIAEAKAILDAVKADGSYGVHNFKYTEARLNDANKILNDK